MAAAYLTKATKVAYFDTSDKRCGKVVFPSRAMAFASIKSHQSTKDRSIVAQGTGKLAPYRCPMCGHWHLGHTGSAYGSKYRGVIWNPYAGRWAAGIRVHNQQHNLGLFAKERDAARAYDDAARYFNEQGHRIPLNNVPDYSE